MVLAELGGQIKDAIGKLQNATVIDEEALDAVLKEICAALMHSDCYNERGCRKCLQAELSIGAL